MEVKRLARSTTDRQIAGVCGGIAEYLSVDPMLVRVLFLFLLLGGEGLLIYGVLWLIMPEDTMPIRSNTQPGPLTRSASNRVIAGVCGGIADYFRIDVTLVRLVFVLAALSGGTGILLYIMLAILIPDENARPDEKPKRDLSV